MQTPIFARDCGSSHKPTRKLAGDVLVFGLAGVFAAGVLAFSLKLAPPVASDAAKSAVALSADSAGTGESTGDFLERVARAHVASLTAPTSPIEAASGEHAAPANLAAPRPAAALRRGAAHPGKAQIVSVDAVSPPPAQSPASEAAPAKFDWMAPVHYGMQLAGDAGKFVVASKERVVETIASAGATLTSFGKKPQQ